MNTKVLITFLPFIVLGCWLVTASPVEEKTPEAAYRKSDGSVLNKHELETDGLRDTRVASIYETNMPVAMQTQILSYVNTAYSLSSDRVYISQLLQSYMNAYQPNYRWNVVINYAAISYYSNYYAIVRQNSDYLIIFG
ncbi:uncharacterized protein LOC108742090 [Agrilus planipennis]|uniref:Uncharacterized protein LOC108742090 n=1 Tax=Agrilus planipennis TaxID=224129 RepID=A0A1W4XJQ5_AGRPL|nr:uncharacterized protein LOC108742090 [Agrilus planipennis]